MGWLVIDGYEDEPAAFGVPPYIGFHIRYVCGVLESRNIDYDYVTIDDWRLGNRPDLSSCDGIVLLAGAIVPGKYLRGTPISLRATEICATPCSTNRWWLGHQRVATTRLDSIEK